MVYCGYPVERSLPMRLIHDLKTAVYPHTKTPVIAFFGDSVTHGAVSSGEINYETVYWNRLRQKILNVRNYVPVNAINAGIGGITAKSSLDRIESQVLSHLPDLVIVCFGLNDVNGSLDDYLLALKTIFEKCLAFGTEVIFMTPNMLNTYVADDTKEEMLKQGKFINTELTFTHKVGEKSYDLSETHESNGTMRFLGMAVILNFLLKKNQFMSIDEVETSIHYELLSYFIRLFLANSDGTSQLLLTTHDINLLNEEFIRRDTIWFTDKDELGETKILRLSSLGLHKNLSPYNAYKQGKLVKLPFLGSQYFNLNEL